MTNIMPPAWEIKEEPYVLKWASTSEEIDAALRLRFSVFNEELNEGLERSVRTGRDKDDFDDICHHLLVVHLPDNRVIGTYRMMTRELLRQRDFYSAAEFDLSRMPEDILNRGVELGRACIAREHRNIRVLYLLWKGICSYLVVMKKRYLFGCASLTSQDPADGLEALEHIRAEKFLHPDLLIPARPDYRCVSLRPLKPAASVVLPRLFKTYIMYGSRVCSEPAIDRDFKTIDFLILFDAETLDPKTYDFFFKAGARS